MNIPQLPAEGADRARWLKIAAAAWLLLVSVLAVVNSVGLSRLAEQSQASAQDAHVQALNTRVAELEQQSAASKNQPKPVAQPDFEAARKALDERLSQVEQAQTADNRAGDLQALYESRYASETFVDVLPAGSHPETRSVRGANTCRIAVHRPQGGDAIVVLSVIDNLVKGAAGQAVQNMNIMFGLPEDSGLN